MRRASILAATAMVCGITFIVNSGPAFAAAVDCTGEMTGSLPAVNVPSGVDCAIHDASIGGSITVQPGAEFAIDKATVAGGVVGRHADDIFIGMGISGASGPVSINGDIADKDNMVGLVLCMATVRGDVTVNGGRPPWIGDPEADETHDLPCAGNTIHGNVSVTNNNGQNQNDTSIEANKIDGSLTFNRNSANSLRIEGNSVRGSISCRNNAPAPTNRDGSTPDPNTATGGKNGQCANL